MPSGPRLALATVLAGALTFATVGAAAELGGVTARTLGAGRATISSCDGNGVGVAFSVTDGIVRSVTISDLASACVNGRLKLVLTDATGATIGAGGPVTVDSASSTVTLSPQPSAAAVAATHISITGP